MNIKDQFINAGFTVIGDRKKPNRLLEFLKENHPSLIRDNEIKSDELKAALGLPVDEKVNGYGLNFVGRNVARAKYAVKTGKELSINTALSKNFDTTQNMVLKGDNLDSLKILKSHYHERIKCIYIDPPYNTTSDEFVYPDKFDKEEAEVLSLANISESDFERLEFSFKTKKSHNGWLSFMYPRLMLARDLLAKDGVIFISIDDNEQANLKLLCDEIFGEENFVEMFSWVKTSTPPGLSNKSRKTIEYILTYEKNRNNTKYKGELLAGGDQPLLNRGNSKRVLKFPKDKVLFKIPDGKYKAGDYDRVYLSEPIEISKGKSTTDFYMKGEFKWIQSTVQEEIEKGTTFIIKSNKFAIRFIRKNEDGYKAPTNLIKDKFTGPVLSKKESNVDTNETGSSELDELLGGHYFNFPKPVSLVKHLVNFLSNSNDIILDFFAGSGTTGHAVMQLNAEDGGNRKFILCQIDEPVKKDKPAYKFCMENNLPPVISSITIERLRRAGEKIKTGIETENKKTGLFEENKKPVPDIGFKVFDSVNAPKLELKDGNIIFPETGKDPLSRIYNMIFSVGIDSPTEIPECIVENCIYKTSNNYYITNAEKATTDDINDAVKSGKVFIDGWTASINATLQHYKEDVDIVF